MNLRLKVTNLKTKTLVTIITTFILGCAIAHAELTDVVEDYREVNNDIVQKIIPVELNAPYKYRRETHGFTIDMGYENLQFINYYSIVDGTTQFYDMFGDIEIPLYYLQGGYKYNFGIGALTANLGIGQANYFSRDSGISRELIVTKYSVSASYIMDVLFDEPYIAPYASFGINQFTLEEQAGDVKASTGIEAAYFYSFGALIQLNWIDQKAALGGLRDNGLQNTYVDVHVSVYEPGLDPDDPNTETEYSLGAGIKMEF